VLILNGLSYDLWEVLWLDSLRSNEVKRVANGARVERWEDGDADGTMVCGEDADELGEVEVRGGAGWG